MVKQSDLVISPLTFPDLGFLALVNCTRMTVKNLELANNGQGLVLAFTTNSTITQNFITNDINGVGLYSSSKNIISVNGITKNNRGIYLFESSNNTISLNNITNNDNGIGFSLSSHSIIYHNRFINNTKQVTDVNMEDRSKTLSVNIWDNGYPSGGNYWSDYTGQDSKSGSNQDQHGSDDIGDTPYIIYENNKDNYPLMLYLNAPGITIVSPENKTYSVNYVSLIFVVNKSTSWIGYSLDRRGNVTITANITLAGLSEGSHSLIVYAKDAAGNTGASETIYFSIKTQQSEPFPTWIVAATAIIAIGVAAVLVYFKKIKKPTRKVKK